VLAIAAFEKGIAIKPNGRLADHARECIREFRGQ
jgi:hypothetical protein